MVLISDLFKIKLYKELIVSSFAIAPYLKITVIAKTQNDGPNITSNQFND